MPGNEFEKQVQGQLDRFGLEPSASVWKGVEREITSKRRNRRIILFFLLPLAIGAGWIAVYQLGSGNGNNNGKGNTASAEKTTTPRESKAEAQTRLPAGGQNDKGTDEDNVDQAPAGRPTKRGTSGSDVKTPGGIGSDDRSNPNPSMVATDGKKNKTRRNRALQVEGEMLISTGAPSITKKADAGEKVAVVPGAETAIPEGDVVYQKNRSDSAVDSRSPKADSSGSVPDEKLIAQNAEPPGDKKEKTAARNKKSLRWGAEASAGFTSNNRGSLVFGRFASFDLAYTPNSGAGIPPVVNSPSVMKPGFSYRAGLLAEWQFSPRSSLSAGIQYAYVSNKTAVGVRSDTSFRLAAYLNSSQADVNVSNLYVGPQTNDYINKYHFFRLPVNYQWKINRGDRVQLIWSGGLAVEYLFSSRALLYSSALGGSYYEDRNAYNKIHFSLGSGLSLRFAGRKGYQWSVGPEFSFDLTPLMKSSSNQYLSFGGINTKLTLPKRK